MDERACLSGANYGGQNYGYVQSLLRNIRLGREWLTVTNAPVDNATVLTSSVEGVYSDGPLVVLCQ